MNHRRQSRYVKTINPDSKRFINTCSACGRQGYAPQVEKTDFATDLVRAAVRRVLLNRYERLPVDAQGLCPVCAETVRHPGT
jgi:hypothetical protein